MAPFLLYGATGYTGGLIAREAVRRGLRPVLAAGLGLAWRAFALENGAAVLNCAGPFARTAAPLVEGCLRTHYLDLTGEAPVFEALATRDAGARERYAGFQAPALAYGADFILAIPGVARDDE